MEPLMLPITHLRLTPTVGGYFKIIHFLSHQENMISSHHAKTASLLLFFPLEKNIVKSKIHYYYFFCYCYYYYLSLLFKQIVSSLNGNWTERLSLSLAMAIVSVQPQVHRNNKGIHVASARKISQSKIHRYQVLNAKSRIFSPAHWLFVAWSYLVPPGCGSWGCLWR